MIEHADKTKANLADLATLASRTEAAERKILERAQARLEEVQSAIEKSRPGVESSSEDAQDRYLSLIAERGQLNTVISKARAALS